MEALPPPLLKFYDHDEMKSWGAATNSIICFSLTHTLAIKEVQFVMKMGHEVRVKIIENIDKRFPYKNSPSTCHISVT
jgi:hypothetical protein